MQGDNRFRKLWISIFFVCFALFLLSPGAGPNQPWNPVEQLIVEITTPFQYLCRQTIKATRDLWTNYFHLIDVRSENRGLKQEMEVLKRENSHYKELLATYERLRSLLQFKERIREPAIAAQVIGVDPTGWFRSIIIDKGKNDGIKWDMPVVNALGVVGRVVSVSDNYAKVLLIIDQNSAVDCLVERSRDRGIVRGTSTGVCKMDYVAKSCDVAAGDLVITSGLGGVFPKGLPIGRISSVREGEDRLFKDIDVIPSVNFSRLEEVLVIQRVGLIHDEK